jgi:hypothetical protein
MGVGEVGLTEERNKELTTKTERQLTQLPFDNSQASTSH